MIPLPNTSIKGKVCYTSFLPFDVIYKIYFYVDDYCTANNFFLLCKDFYNNFMKNKARDYKFNILHDSLFSFLMLLPETFNTNENIGDLTFYELLMCQSQNNHDKIMLSKDIRFIYHLYKNFFVYYFANDTNKNSSLTIATNLSNIIILQGPTFINNLVKLEYNGNIVSIKSRFKNRSEMFGYILEHYNRYNSRLLRYQIELAIS
jgi:hypothetical protein